MTRAAVPAAPGQRLPPAPVRVWRPVPTGLGPNGKRTASRRVEVTLPYRHGTRRWLRSVCGAGSRPEFDRVRKVWLVSRPHFGAVVAALVGEYGAVDVYADHTARSACGALCREAVGDECDCSCLGENHGGQVWRKEWIKLSEEWLVINVKVRTHYRVDATGWHRAEAR